MADTTSTLFQNLSPQFSPDDKVGTVCVLCEARKAERLRMSQSGPAVVPTHECDLSSVMLTLVRTGAPTRFLIFSDADRAKGEMCIEVLANPQTEIKGTAPADTTQLSLAISPYASCSSAKHPMLIVTPAGGDDVECRAISRVKTKHDTPLYRRLRNWEGDWASSGDTFQLWQLLQWFWGAFSDSHMGQIDIDVTTCAVRKAGKIVGSAKLAIHLYPIESYSFALSLPPLWSRKRVNSKQLKTEFNTDPPPTMNVPNAPTSFLIPINKQTEYGTNVVSQEDKFFFSPKTGWAKSTVSQTQEMDGQDVKVTRDTVSATSGKTVFSGSLSKVDGEQRGQREFNKGGDTLKSWERWGIKLALKRNGSNLDFEVGRFASTVTRMLEAYDSFKKGMTTAVKGEASVGLTLSGELNLLVVDFTVTWQRKEDGQQPKVPWNVSITVTGKLIDATLTAVYGVVAKCTCHTVEIFNFEGTVTVAFNGNVPVSITNSAVIRDGHWQWNAQEEAIKAALGVSISGKTTAKVMGRGAEIIITGASGLTVESKLDRSGPGRFPALKSSIDFSGITLTVSLLGLDGTVFQSKPIALINPHNLVKDFVIGHPGKST